MRKMSNFATMNYFCNPLDLPCFFKWKPCKLSPASFPWHWQMMWNSRSEGKFKARVFQTSMFSIQIQWGKNTNKQDGWKVNLLPLTALLSMTFNNWENLKQQPLQVSFTKYAYCARCLTNRPSFLFSEPSSEGRYDVHFTDGTIEALIRADRILCPTDS